MRKMFFVLAFMLIGSFSFASSSILINDNVELLDACTVTTTRTFYDANGDVHKVSVTNTGKTCFDAWKRNQDQLASFERGIEPAR